MEFYHPPPINTHSACISSMEQYREFYRKSLADPDSFWVEQAKNLYWHKTWNLPVSSWNIDMNKGSVYNKWFSGALTNVSFNCLDRNIKNGHGERIAILAEGNEPNSCREITYDKLFELVCRIANYMKSIGIKKGTNVTICMPLVPELPAAMLACARIGAIHSVVFAGYSAMSLADRILDSSPQLIITSDISVRGKKIIKVKELVDEALNIVKDKIACIPQVLVHQNTPNCVQCPISAVRDDLWSVLNLHDPFCDPVWLDAEDVLFKLYTSGSTGKPKAIIHTQGGYMTSAYATFKYVYDYKQSDIYWCTADCGWITDKLHFVRGFSIGHTYVTYGPMLHAATQVILEGDPLYPDPGRIWSMVDKYKVSILYTSPTIIRSLMRHDLKYLHQYNRDSLRIVGSNGEPIGPEAWKFIHEEVCNGSVSIVDTYWQTETGSNILSPLPGATPMKPGSATLPLFGIDGEELVGEATGYLVVKSAWPSMARSIANDHARYEDVYFSKFKGYYMTGDSARRDKDGYYWLLGRVDDVINVSGHRIGTAEVEGAIGQHEAVAEAAVVPMPHLIKGQAIFAFVNLKEGVQFPPPDSLRKEVIDLVRKIIGPLATPEVIQWVRALPKTRTGKIMRRILKKIACNDLESSFGDVSTLINAEALESILADRKLIETF